MIIIFTALLGASEIVLAVLLFFNQITLDQVTSPNRIISPIVSESPLYILLRVFLFGADIYVQVISSRTFDFEKTKLFERWSAANR